MQPPSDLGAPGREAFLAAVKALEAYGETPANHAPAIAAYARLRDDVAKLRDSWHLDGDPTYAVGSRGQLCVHPMLKGIQDAESAATAAASALGIAPGTRKRSAGGAPMGTHHAEDRKPKLKRAA
jgi:phage terminase small subunit